MVTRHITPITLADNAYFDLPASSAGFGTFFFGGDSYGISVYIHWGTNGEIYYHPFQDPNSNLSPTDNDGHVCIFDNGTSVRIKNTMSATLSCMFDYHYTTTPTGQVGAPA
jgi:hypothetical protein